MVTKKQQINCPKCGENISIDDVLTHQIEERVKKDMQEENDAQAEQFALDKKELELQKSILEKAQVDTEKEVSRKVSEKLTEEKISLRKEIQAETKKEMASEKKLLEERIIDRDKKLKVANENELALRKEKQSLKDEKDAFELEKTRQLDEERKKIVEEASKKAEEESKYQIAQLQKQVSDATKAKDELARKLEQGSQQTQGEVLELELEDLLTKEFVYDDIVPVPKGMSGADIIQKVKSQQGRSCGQIIWELKKTKTWSNGWIKKLKDDQRAIKADIAVIVSHALPDDVKGFVFHEGVWICDISLVLALATSLRINLESISNERQMSEGKDEKMEVLYKYLTGVEFKQRVEAIVESFSSMSDSLKKERIAYERIWSEREKQIQAVIKNTVGIYGDLNGVVQLQKIEALELPSGDEDKK